MVIIGHLLCVRHGAKVFTFISFYSYPSLSEYSEKIEVQSLVTWCSPNVRIQMESIRFQSYYSKPFCSAPLYKKQEMRDLAKTTLPWKIQRKNFKYYFQHIPGFWSWSRMGFRMFGNPWWTTRSWPALRFYTSRSSRWRFWLRARLLTKKTVLQMALVT